MKDPHHPNIPSGILLFLSLTGILLLTPIVSDGAEYRIPMGGFDSIYGNKNNDLIYCYKKKQGTWLIPMEEQSPEVPHEDTYFGAGCFDRSGFTIGIFCIGEKKLRIEDCGGSISIYLRQGKVNEATDSTPASIHYSLEKHIPKEPLYPDLVPFDNENRKMNDGPNRLSFDTMAYGNRYNRVITVPPWTIFRPFDKGWGFFLKIDWYYFRDSIPFQKGKFPTPWRLILTRTRPDGTKAAWGTIDSPIILNWGRPGEKLVKQVQDANLTTARPVGSTYRSAAGFLRTKWTIQRAERWMDHLKLEEETFEASNPESDDLFFTHYLEPVLDANVNLDEAVYYNRNDGIDYPPFCSYPDKQREAILKRVDDLIYFREGIEDMRRDYLLTRFLDEPVVKYVSPLGGENLKPKGAESGPPPLAGDLELEGDEGMIIELDEEIF